MVFQRVRLILTNTFLILLNSATTWWLSSQVYKPRPLFFFFFFFWEPGIETVRGGCSVLGTQLGQGASLPLIFLLGWVAQDFLLLRGHVGHEIYPPVVVALFVSIPENELCKLIIESNARLSIKSQETAWFSVLQRISFSGPADSCSQPSWCHCNW